MQKLWKISTFTLAAMLAAVIGSGSINDAAADRQPHMRSALQALKSAYVELDKATPDKGGHRVKARSLTQQAIEQVEQGIKFDNRY